MNACVTLLVLLLFMALIVLVIRAVTSSSSAPAPRSSSARRPFRHCPGCDERVFASDEVCPECGLRLESPTATQLYRLRITLDELDTLHETGTLDTAALKPVQDALETRRDALLRPTHRTSPRTVPPPEHRTVPPPLPTANVVTPEETRHVEQAEPPAREPRPGPTAPTPVPPKRTFGEMLGQFMHERNILWGELIGGLLIVGCSVALVLSLWRTLEELPYFTFALFAGITVAVFAAGEYTLHHWKLAATSRGLLLIALLLTPLNLLLLADPGTRGTADNIDLVVKVLTVGGFAWLVRTAGRDLVGIDELRGWLPRRWLLALAIVGTVAIPMLPITGDAAIYVPLWGPFLCAAFATGPTVRRLSREYRTPTAPALPATIATAVLLFVGLALFALFAAWAYQLTRADALDVALRRVAGPLAFVGLPLLSAGLLIQKKLAEPLGLKIIGTATALVGLVLSFLSFAVAWPEPKLLLFVALSLAALLTWMAHRDDLPWLHTFALPCAVVAVLLGRVLFDVGDMPTSAWLGDHLLNGAQGLPLTLTALTLFALSEWLRPRRTAQTYALMAGVVALMSVTLASLRGVHAYPVQTTLVYYLLAAGTTVAAWRYASRTLAEIGVWLLLPGTLALLAQQQAEYVWWAATLAGVGLLFGIFATVLWERVGFARTLAAACRNGCLGASVAGVLFVLEPLARGSEPHGPQSIVFFVVSGSAFVLAWLYRQWAFTGAGAMALVGAFLHLHAVTFAWESLELAYLAAFLWSASLLALVPFGLRKWPTVGRFFDVPVRWLSPIVALPGVVLLFFPPATHLPTWVLGCVAYAGLWFLVRWQWSLRFSFALGQTLLAWGSVLLAATWCQRQDWLAPFGWLEPQYGQAYLLALGLFTLTLLLVQRTTRAAAVWREQPHIGNTLTVGVLLGQFALTLTQIVPPILTELTPRTALPLFGLAGHYDWHVLAWLVLGVCAVNVLLRLRFAATEPERRWLLVGGGVVAFTVPFLGAGLFIPDVAAATATRFGMAFLFVVGAVLHGTRRSLRARFAAWQMPWPTSPTTLHEARFFWLSAAGLVVGLSVWLAGIGFMGEVPTGPLPDTFFHQLGTLFTTLVPLALVVFALAGTAYRDRAPTFALAASLLATLTVSGGYALSLTLAKEPLTPTIALFGIVTLAVASLAWLAVARRIPDRGARTTNIILCVYGLTALLLLLTLRLLVEPSWIPSDFYRGVGTHGWYTLAAVLLAVAWHERQRRYSALIAGLGVFGVGVLAAYTANLLGESAPWYSVQVLGIMWSLGLAALVGFHDKRSVTGRDVVSIDMLAGGLAFLAFVVATHAHEYQAHREAWSPYFPAGLLGVAAAALLVLANRAQTLWRDYLAAGYLVLASGCAWLVWGQATPTNLALDVVVGLAIAVAAGTFRTPRSPAFPPMPHTLGVLGLLVLAVGCGPTLAGTEGTPILAWLAGGALAVAFGVLHGDRTAVHANAGLFTVGALLVGVAIHHTRGGAVWFDPVTPVALAAYTSGAAIVMWFTRTEVRSWFLMATGTAALFVLAMSVRTALHEATLGVRLVGSGATALLLPATLLLAPRAHTFAPLVRLATLVVGVLVCGLLGWAVPEPDGVVPWLQRHSWLFVALAVAVVLYSAVLPRWLRADHWGTALRHGSGVLFVAALVALCVLLAQQIPQYDPLTQRTPLATEAVYAGLAGLFLMLGVSLRFALRPTSDPLGPTPHGRTGYVYVAEVLLVFVFVMMKLNLPGVFNPKAVQYWTFTVMVFAFVGVGMAELFARQRMRVLAVPLLRTGALLPLLPLLAFWAKPPGFLLNFADDHAAGLRPMLGYLEKLPQHYDAYAALWFLAGLLYGLIALSRRSFGWALIGALATNAGLWCLLAYHQVPALVHPQAWAIPLALIILVTEHVHRANLRASTALGMRYAGISMIYLSSAADLFIAGVGQSVWLPVVLATLCVLGVLLGMLLRVRAFLFLGSGFLLLDIFAMIWHAAVDRAQTWVWYVSGIVLGAIIIAVFAVLEKRRNSVVGLVDRLRTWQA